LFFVEIRTARTSYYVRKLLGDFGRIATTICRIFN